MVKHFQNPSTAVDFSNLQVEEVDGVVSLQGSMQIKGQMYSVDVSYDVVEGLQLFVTDDGLLSTSAAGAFAHLLWFDGTELHVITHTGV